MVDSGQQGIHWIEMFSNKSARKGEERRPNLLVKCFTVSQNKRKQHISGVLQKRYSSRAHFHFVSQKASVTQK